MVNMVGFSHDHYGPKANSTEVGAAGSFLRIEWLLGGAIKVGFPCGTARFESLHDARAYVDAPGDVGLAARAVSVVGVTK
ncbi:hypothetical protein GCM10022239_03600 [Leifsonia bigeumensis]|uniref:Uncharacterized protein n=1 Tax=Leifsonella bigeumensis TaxID=433643 RepID=A0ABP7F2K0_9MICO